MVNVLLFLVMVKQTVKIYLLSFHFCSVTTCDTKTNGLTMKLNSNNKYTLTDVDKQKLIQLTDLFHKVVNNR